MIVCPLCQNEQAQGIECDVCGRPFPKSLVQETGHADLPVEPVPGFEATVIPPVDEIKTTVSENAACNWCGHMQQAGRVCERCGMQRHRGLAPVVEQESASQEEMGLCGECGFYSPPPRCTNCGSRVSTD